MKLKKGKKRKHSLGNLIYVLNNLCGITESSEGSSTVKVVSIAVSHREGPEFESISWVKFACFPHIRMGSLQVQLVGLG